MELASIVAVRYFAGAFDAAVQQRLFANTCVDLTFIALIAYLRHSAKRAAAKLDSERARWKRIVGGIADEVWICDLQGRMSLVNLPTVTHMNLKEFKDNTLEQVLDKVDIFNPDGTPRPPGQAPLLRVLRGEQNVRGEELMRHGANERWRQFSAGPIYTEDGQLEGAVAVVRDITEQKLLERALITNEKLAATGRLAATMAHEINNPLTAITNLVYLMEASSPDPTLRGHLSMLRDQIKTISRITTQTLKFNRDSSQPTEFKVSELLRDVLEFYSHEAKKRQVSVKQHIKCEGAVFGFKGEIIQVVSNLLINALHATPAGGQVIAHLYAAPRWMCEARKQTGYCISIADSGSGIDPQHRKRIFEPFFTTKGEKGTGLGLWVCMGIVQRAGGSIRVWSTRRPTRSGTCFSIFLPPHSGVELPAREHLDNTSVEPLEVRRERSA